MPSKKKDSSLNAIVIIGIMLAAIGLAALHPITAALNLVCLLVVGIVVRLRRVSARMKLAFLTAGIFLVISANLVEGWQIRREEQLELKQAHEQAAKREEAFRAMTPSEHLQRLKSLLVVNASPTSVSEALKNLAAIPEGTAEAKEAARVKQRYDEEKRIQLEEQKKADAAAAKKKAAEEAALNRVLRDKMAKTLENKLLDEGYSVDVVATGANHTTLHIKWVLVSKALAHQLSEQSDFFEAARKVGFKRIEITDGYDQEWYWKLD